MTTPAAVTLHSHSENETTTMRDTSANAWQCPGCGDPLQGKFRLGEDGQMYHLTCEPPQQPISDEERAALLARFPTPAHTTKGTFTAKEVGLAMRARRALTDSPEWLAAGQAAATRNVTATMCDTPVPMTHTAAAGGFAPERGPRTRSRFQAAKDEARACATCNGELDDRAEVWVRRAPHQTRWGTSREISPHCATCTDTEQKQWWATSYRPPVPCAGCGRSVHLVFDLVRRRSVVCSERCRAVARNAARRQQRHAVRQRRCLSCSQPFLGRRNARTCSARCRQALYRGKQHL